MESDPIKLIGINADVELYQDRVIIRRPRKALWTYFVYKNMHLGDKTIFIKDITGITVKNHSNVLVEGYIQFTLPGSTRKTNNQDLLEDENTVSFGNGKKNNAIAQKIKSEIEEVKKKAEINMSGIYANGDLNISDIHGPFTVGKDIYQNQNQYQSISEFNLKELRESLFAFQKEIEKLGLDPDYQNIVNGNISYAVLEVKKEKPQLSDIKQYFEKTIQLIKVTGKTISNISELYEPAQKIALILGIGISFLH